MDTRLYKKMAGTAAVFLSAGHSGASPVERDGMSWTDAELGIPAGPKPLHWKPPMETTLALEGLEEYDPPAHGDARFVIKTGAAFAYVGKIRGWVEITAFA